MKKLVYLTLVLPMLLLAGCKYDDSLLTSRVDDLDKRVTSLEEICNHLNTNVTSLQTLVTVMQTGDYITSINTIYENGEPIGYTISFAKSASITIYHGKNG